MRLIIPQVLPRDAVAQFREQLSLAQWADGRISAGTQAQAQKNNLQLPENTELAKLLSNSVLDHLGKSAQFFAAALPKKIYPPLFNCYSGSTNSFGNHVDNAVRTHAASQTHVRTDLSFTLFLSDPDEYDGGELVIEDGAASARIKLPAGDMLLYPASSLHRVEAVTRGARICCFSWLQSMVRADEQRSLLYALDMSLMQLRQKQDNEPSVLSLTACYHNLLRMWAEV
ncbi:MAG: Fe2+-dependent dioxygenase [Pseudomonadota bacterium]